MASERARWVRIFTGDVLRTVISDAAVLAHVKLAAWLMDLKPPFLRRQLHGRSLNRTPPALRPIGLCDHEFDCRYFQQGCK